MRLLIAGGGTGGHLYPGIAIAERIVARSGGEVLFVGTARGIETKQVPAAGFSLELLDVSGLNRVGASAVIRGLSRLPRAFVQARAVLQRFRPDVVIGVGGYASGPMVLAAALLGYPTAIQEQNSYPGVTNRVLGRFVRRVFIAFDQARAFFKTSKVKLVGNPVRAQFGLAPTTSSASSSASSSSSPPANLVLVLGGSQGARAVNDLVVKAAIQWYAAGRLPRIVHQTGDKDESRVRTLYADIRLPPDVVDVLPFIHDMPKALRAADLVIARAGALTLAELAIVGRAAILIPLPTAANDHQTRNAAEFQRAGAAMVLCQGSDVAANAADLGRMATDILGDVPRRTQMEAAMSKLARPDAAHEIAADLETMATAERGTA